jgi:hypothetical protein
MDAPGLGTWPAWYEPSQMLCHMVSPPAASLPGTASSWHYYPAEITHTRRFLSVSTSNDTFYTHVVTSMRFLITELRETPALLRCSPLPDSLLDTIRSPTCANSLTMLRPYRRGSRISFFTRRRNLPLSHCMQGTQCNPTARKGMVASPYSFLTHYLLYLEIKHLTTYASLPTATTTVCPKTRKHFTFGTLTHQVGTRIMITM